MVITADEARERFAARLREVLDDAGAPKAGRVRWLHNLVHRHTSITYEAVRKWVSGEALPRDTRRGLIADVLEVNADWLFLGRGPKRPGEVPGQLRPPGGRVPLVSWVQAGRWTRPPQAAPGDVEEIDVDVRVGPRSFALRVQGDSMEPRVPDGSVIVVDPDKRAETGSLVVARLEGDEEATLKKYVREAGGRKYLEPLNPRYEPIPIDSPMVICGVVRRIYLDDD